MAFLLIVAFASLLASPSLLSASSPPGEGGFEAVLKHVDHAEGLTSDEHLKRSVQRSKMSLETTKAPPPFPSAFVDVGIKSGFGEFYMNLTIGTPPTTYRAVIDTDTDFIWTSCTPMQCGVRGNNCSKIQPYDPTKSSTYKKLSCTSVPCTQATTNTSCNKKDNGCIYHYQYPTGSPGSIQGDLAIETFGSSSFYGGKASAVELIFGCTHATSIVNFTNIRSGFVGLGRGKMSLVSQLNFTSLSHCFPSYDNPESFGVVAFGSYAKIKKVKRTVFSNLLQNPINRPSAYYVALKGIKVNGKPLAINTSAFEINTTAGVGGVVIDSGMSISYLEKGVFEKLKGKLNSLILLPKVNDSDAGLKVCYETSTVQIEEYNVPKIAFTFGNGNKLNDLVLPKGNAFRSYEDPNHGHIMCLAMAAAPASDGRSSLGNMQLQDTLVVYDLVANKVSFTSDAC